jgi:hypothetical protein
LLGLVILLILKSTFACFYRFLLKDAIVVEEVVDLVFCYLACNVFSLLALVLIIKAFLAYTLGIVVLIAFLPIIYKHVFFITIIGAILVLKPIFLLSLTSLGVALYLYLNTFSLYLGHLSSLSFISN